MDEVCETRDVSSVRKTDQSRKVFLKDPDRHSNCLGRTMSLLVVCARPDDRQ